MRDFTAKDVLEIYTRVRKKYPSRGLPHIWKLVKEEFEEYASSRTTGDIGQAWRNTSGKAFEVIVGRIIKNVLTKEKFTSRKVSVKSFNELDSSEIKDVSCQLKRRCSGTNVSTSYEPDIVVFKDHVPKIIISCKTSLRVRVSMDLFWSEKYRALGCKFVLVSAETVKKLGTCGEPKKVRALAEAIYDRLYIVGDMHYCDIVRPFRDIEGDMEKWLLAGSS